MYIILLKIKKINNKRLLLEFPSCERDKKFDIMEFSDKWRIQILNIYAE